MTVQYDPIIRFASKGKKRPRQSGAPSFEEITGYSRSSAYEFIKNNELEPPLRLGPMAVGWRYSYLLKWVEQRIAKEVA